MNADNLEYNELIERLRDNHARRNQAQLFAFTASFALLAVLVSPNEGISGADGALFLLPYVALLPLSCKIAYSRICHARIDAYLSVAYPGKRIESDYESIVPDLGKGAIDRLITYGVNFEPLLIGFLASALTIESVASRAISPFGYMTITLSIVLPVMVWAILRHGLDYSHIRSSFVQKWESVLAPYEEDDF